MTTNDSTGAQAAPAQMIKRSLLRTEPRLQPRVYYRNIDELAASLKEHGLIEPLIARPAKDGSGLFDVGAGARRLKAAEIAGIDELLVIVRDLSDRQMVELSITENGDREGLHPLEEGEAFRRLHFGWKELGLDAPVPIAELASRFGRSKSYVLGRIRLATDLCVEAKELFGEWRMDVTGALALLRISDAERQAKAVRDLLEHRPPDHVLKAEAIADYVQRRFLLNLLDAKFPKKDAELVLEAGACTTCPKRSGNQPELFEAGGEKKDDLCTDPECFGWKKDAYRRRVLDGGTAPVLDEKTAKTIFKAGSGAVAYDSPWVALDAPCYEDAKERTYKALFGKDAPPASVVIDPEGWPRMVVRREDAVKALRVAGHPFASEVERSGDQAAQAKEATAKQSKDAKAKADAKARRAAVDGCLLDLEIMAARKAPSKKALLLLAKGVLAVTWADTKSEYAKRHRLDDTGVKGSKKEKSDKLLLARLGTLSEQELIGFLFGLVLSRDAYQAAEAGKDARRTTVLFEAFEAYGIDFDVAFAAAKKGESVASAAKAKPEEKPVKAVAKATIKVPLPPPAASSKASTPSKPAKKAAPRPKAKPVKATKKPAKKK